MKWKDIPKDALKELYLEKEKSAREISDIYGCSVSPVMRAMRRYGIPRRSYSEAQIVRSKRDSAYPVPDRKNLEKLYLKEKLSVREVGRTLGIPPSKVRFWMCKYGIERRTPGESNALKAWGRSIPSKRKIRRLYITKRLSMKEIGNKFGVRKTAVQNLMDEYGIKRRDIQEAKLGFNPPFSPGNGEWLSEDLILDYLVKNPREFGYDEVFIDHTSEWDAIGIKDNELVKLEIEQSPEQYKYYHKGEADLIITYYGTKQETQIPYKQVDKEKFLKHVKNYIDLGLIKVEI